MHIQQIEIDNFKSFVGRTVVPFQTGFTTVSGPNGSGKSNIIDSVLFCLGLSTSRTMRAEKLTDLINHHAKRREATVTITFNKGADIALPAVQGDEAKPQPESAVDTVLNATEDEENSEESEESQDGEGSSDTSEPDNDQFITVARRIKDGSSGYTSTYYLNGKVSTLTEIHEYLSRFNVSPGCYNVMMQGDVAGIVNMSPMERRKIIDEIAGVAEFDRKIEQAQRELEATGSNIERNQILLVEIETRLEQLLAERDKALKYKKLRQEKHNYETKLVVARLRDLEKALTAAREGITTARNKKTTLQADLKQLEQTLVETRKALTAMSEEVKRKGEDQYIAIQKQIEGLKGHIARKEDAISFIDKQVKENHETIEKSGEEITRLGTLMEGFQSDIAQLNHQKKELEGFRDKEKKQLEKLNHKFDGLHNAGGEWTAKRTDVRTQLEAVENKLSFLQRQHLDLEAEKNRLVLSRDMQLKTSSEVAQKLQVLQDRRQVIEESVQNLAHRRQDLENQLHGAQRKFSEVKVALNSNQDGLNKLIGEYSRLDARKKAYDEVSFARPVEAILQSGMKGIHGTVAQLADVDSNYALALEVAMGGRLQNLVVDDDRVAKAGIDFLRQNRAGKATFLPLNKIRRARSLPILPNEAGVVDYAINLVDFDPQYEDIFSYALGDTLVMEDIDSARRLLSRYRMVTLDGSIMEKTGAMTGGSQRSQGTGALSNTKQLEEELRQLEKRMDARQAEREELNRKLTQAEMGLESLQRDMGECSTNHAKAQTELEGVDGQIRDLKGSDSSSEGDASPEIKVANERIGEIESNLAVVGKQIQEQETVRAGLKGELEAIEGQIPSDQMNELKKEMDEVQFQFQYYDTQLRQVETDIKDKEREQQYQTVTLEECHKRIEKSKEQNESLMKEKAEHLEEVKLTQTQIRDLETQTGELDAELKRLQKERDDLQNTLLDQEKQKGEVERSITQCDEQVLAYQARCRELEPDIQATRQELEENPPEDPAILEMELPPETEIHQAITKLTKRMEAMEPVNMLAIEEYDAVSNRKGELAEKVDTLVRECEALNLKITGYEELKRLSFMKAFDHVDAQFKTIFAELSDGHGRLVLTNPDSPLQGGLTIEAQPRGKKTVRIEAMSGGEKSLTSLAFVFSLQRYRPAPFYALDEVDMNLDGLNVEKLANMIGREAKTAQFIVVSLRKPMIERSNRTVGVTQKRNGFSKITGIKHREALGAKEFGAPHDELEEGLRDLTEAASETQLASKRASNKPSATQEDRDEPSVATGT